MNGTTTRPWPAKLTRRKVDASLALPHHTPPLISIQHVLNAALHHHGAMIDPNRAIAHMANRRRRMRHEQHRFAGAAEGHQGFPALLLKTRVSDSQNLVEQ